MKKLIASIIFIVSTLVGFCQNGGSKIVSICKTVNNLDSTKFNYVIHDKGTELLLILRQDDVTSCSGLLFVPISRLISKDKTLNDLPQIPEGKYAEWNEQSSSWKILNGGLKEITNSTQNKKQESNCNLAHFGKFKYQNYPDTSAYIIRDGKLQTEHYENGVYFTTFEIKWLSECDYKLTFVESNDSKMSFIKKGDYLTIQISNVTKKGYDYKANLKGNISSGYHIKIN